MRASPPTTSRGPLLFTLAAVALAARWPLLDAGWGSDMDAWRYVVSAQHMLESRAYQPSRVPGFVGWELVLTALLPFGPVAANLWSALCGAASGVLFAHVAARLQLPRPEWLGLALALSPGLVVSATQAMDYAQATLLLVAGWLALLQGRAALAGALLAAAAVTRPNLLLLAPAALAMLALGGRRASSPARFAAAFAVALFIMRSPAFGHPALEGAGTHFGFHAARQHATADTVVPVLRGALVHLFGRTAPLVMVVGVLLALRPARRGAAAVGPSRPHARHAPPEIVFESLALSLLVGTYLLVPLDPGYLVPALPLALALVARLSVSGAVPWLACACALELMVQPRLAERMAAPGRVAVERAERLRLMNEAVVESRRLEPVPTVVLADRSLLLRMAAHAPGLERTEWAWAPFHAEGVAFWSEQRLVGWANDLSGPMRDSLEARGYRVVDERTVRAGL